MATPKRVPFIAGNWKMNTTLDEAVELVRNMLPLLSGIRGVETAVCPPFVSLAAVAPLLKGSGVGLGAQNMYHQEKGAYTGEVSPLMLTGLCQYVILGHSERRQYFGETDETVNKKLLAALRVGLKPIFCLGETLDDREAGRTEAVVVRQVRGGLEGVGSTLSLVIAYEPIWAIGTGRAATGAQANQVAALIRGEVATLFGPTEATELRIQYGGSVTAANAGQFMSQPDIDGALVGGASLKAEEFAAIVKETAAVKGG
ncbi:MAG: triose-phosphate isomerase [Chloroflexi bacterium]|nr:triose-phosphate isomerase [Chloroflexota bacterium]